MREVVARDVAEQELERFAELMDIDIQKKLAEEAEREAKQEGLPDEESGALAKSRELVIQAIMRGFAVVNDSGEIVYTPQAGGNPLTFTEPSGAAFVSMRSEKSIGAMHAFMAQMTATSPGIFAKLKQRDLKYCWAIALLFLAGS